MKDKVKELLAHIKGVKPSYSIDYTVMDGEIIILKGKRYYDGSPNLILGDVTAELRENEEVIAKFEKDGVNEEKAALFREYWKQETEKDKVYLR